MTPRLWAAASISGRHSLGMRRGHGGSRRGFGSSTTPMCLVAGITAEQGNTARTIRNESIDLRQNRQPVLPFGSPHGCAPPGVLASEGRVNGAATQAQVLGYLPRAEGFMRPGSDEDYTSNSSTLSAVGSVPSVT